MIASYPCNANAHHSCCYWLQPTFQAHNKWILLQSVPTYTILPCFKDFLCCKPIFFRLHIFYKPLIKNTVVTRFVRDISLPKSNGLMWESLKEILRNGFILKQAKQILFPGYYISSAQLYLWVTKKIKSCYSFLKMEHVFEIKEILSRRPTSTYLAHFSLFISFDAKFCSKVGPHWPVTTWLAIFKNQVIFWPIPYISS